MAEGVTGASPVGHRRGKLAEHWDRAKQSAAGRGGASFLVASVGLSASNFVFNAVISRLIGPAGYGALGSLLNVVFVLSVPLAALAAAVTQVVVGAGGSSAVGGYRRMSVQAVVGGTLATGAWSVASPAIAGFLHLGSVAPVLVMGLWIVPASLAAVWQGALMGEGRFTVVAVAQFVGSGVVRLVLAIGLVMAGLGIIGAVLATVSSAVLLCALQAPAMRGRLGALSVGEIRPADAGRSIAGVGGATMLVSLDTWLARHFLDPHAAGYFAAASTAGRIALFMPGAVVLVAFPRFLVGSGRSREAHSALANTAFWVVSASMVVAEVLTAVPSLVTHLLFGAAFDASAPILGIVAVADAAVGLISVLVYYQLARRSRWAMAAWGGCLLMAALASALHGSMRQLAWVMLGANGATALGLVVVTIRGVVRDRRCPGMGNGAGPVVDATRVVPAATAPFVKATPAAVGVARRANPPALGWSRLQLSTVGTGALGTAGIAVLADGIRNRWVSGVSVLALVVAVVLGSLVVARTAVPDGLLKLRSNEGLAARSSRRTHHVGALVVAAVAVVACQSWFVWGKALAGGDIAPPSGVAWIGRLFAPWTWSGSNLGGPGAQQTQLPWAIVLGAVHAAGGPAWLAQRLWLTALFAGAGLTAYALLRVLGLRSAPAVAGALVYLFNPYVLSNVGINSVFLAGMVLLPAYPACILAVARRRISKRWGAGFMVLGAPLLGYAYSNPPLAAMVALTTVVGVAIAAWTGGRREGTRAAQMALIGGGAVALASAYWLVPSLLQISSNGTGQLGATSAWAWTEGRSNLANALWLNTTWGWSYPGYYAFAPGYARLPLSALKYLLPLLAFGVLPVRFALGLADEGRRLERVALAAAGGALFLIVLSTGTKAPGSALFDPLYHLPYGWLLREPGRFLMAAALGYAVLLGVGAQTAADAWAAHPLDVEALRGLRSDRTPLARFAAVGVLIAVLIPAYPLAFGQLAPDHRPGGLASSHSALPPYWTTMARYLNRRAPPGTVMMLPVDDFYQMPYTWGYYGNDGFITDMLSRHVLDPSGQGYAPASSQLLDTVDQVSAALVARQWSLAQRLLGALGVREILVRGDINSTFPGRNIVSPALLAARLRADGGVHLLYRSGPLELFSLKAAPPPTITTTIATVNSPTPDLRVLGLLPAGTSLVTSPLRTGVPGVEQVAGLGAWHLRGNVLSTQMPARRGWTYSPKSVLGAAGGPPSGAGGPITGRLITTGSGRREQLSLALPPSANEISNRTLASGPWQRTVGDCNNVGGAAAATHLHASVVAGIGPGRSRVLRLRASEDSACEVTPVAWGGGSIALSLWARSLTGAPPRICVYEQGPNHCAAIPAIAGGHGWFHVQDVVTPHPGTMALSLFVYADSLVAGHRTITEYADVQAHAVPLITPVVLARPAYPGRPAYLRQSASAYSNRWSGPAGATHVEVDGLRNGWLGSPDALAGDVYYRNAGVVLAAGAVSLATVLGLAALLASWAWRSRRRLRSRADLS